ncbi:hypothetical protein N836_10800 [Leptolyngbya sp. Heron Island J]|nr:hypothetical protein N836_10800 [Leptolyngbya sp. Heron Island J]
MGAVVGTFTVVSAGVGAVAGAFTSTVAGAATVAGALAIAGAVATTSLLLSLYIIRQVRNNEQPQYQPN